MPPKPEEKRIGIRISTGRLIHDKHSTVPLTRWWKKDPKTGLLIDEDGKPATAEKKEAI